MARPPQQARIVAFDEFEVDAGLYQLRRRGAVVKLEPKIFDVLLHLLAHRERVVGKDELLDALWPGEHVSESVLPRCVTALRRALDDTAGAPRFIQTIHGRGYRFIGPLLDPTAPDEAAPPRPGTPFVGRAQAMATLTGALADAAAGRGRVVLLAGEPGIGKTRTAEELAAVARRDGARVLAGRCSDGDGAPAFWPWTQLLRTWLGAPGSGAAARTADAEALGRLVPGLAPESTPVSGLSPEQARFRVFDAVTGALVRAAVEQPLLVVLDDLHAADTPSLLLLRFVAGAIGDAPILLLGTYRDVALRRRHPLATVLGELAREARCERVVLRGLEPAAVAVFLEAATGIAPTDAAVAAVHERTGGNPFFVGELVRLCVAEGVGLDASIVPGLPLPQGVREAVGRRLDMLTGECDALLGAAAVLGREFGVGVLGRVADVPAERVLSLLDEALGARLVQRTPGTPARYAFSHAVVRETRYEELTTTERVRLHRRAGEVLEAICGADPSRTAEIAHHWFEGAPGGDAAGAIAWQRRAAEQALASLAYEEAAVCYERAVEVLDADEAPDATARATLLLGLGEACALAGERQRARAAFQRAADIARSVGCADVLARAALGFAGRAEMGMPRDDVVLALLEEARDTLGDAHPGLRARVLARLAGTAPHSADLATRRALSAEAVALARRDADPAPLGAALSARYWALLGPDHVEERLGIGDDLLALSVRTRDKLHAWLGHEVRLGCLLALGDVGGADAAIDAMATIAEELRLPVERWYACWFRASRALADGRFADVERLIAAGRALGERAQHPGAFFAAHGLALVLAHERGDSCDFARGFEPFIAHYPWAERLRQVGLALHHTETDALDDARRIFAGLAVDEFRDFARDEHWITAMVQLASICTDVDDPGRAAALHALLAPFATRFAVHDLLRVSAGSVAHYLGGLAMTMRRPADAARHFEDALAMHARAGARPFLARTQYDYARLLLQSRARADRDRARTLLGESAATGRALGMPRVVSIAERLRHQADQAPSSRNHQRAIRTGAGVRR